MEFVESQTLEFKEQFNDSCKHTIVAFLSHGSGVIYIGIDKNGKPVKLNDIDAVQRDISNFLIDQVSPRCIELVKTSLEDVDGFTVIKLEVTQGDKLFYIKKYGLSIKGCYIRVGSTTREMTDEEIKRKYETTLNLPRLDIVKMTAYHQNLTFSVLKIYLNEHKVSYEDDSFAETFELLDRNGKYNEMAYLLSDQFNESIKVCRFEKDGRLTLRQEFGRGCLFKIYYDVKDYMRNQVNIPKTTFDGGQRHDIYLYDETAFEEAWKNAILHNDYAEQQYPAIYLYSDHLEVFSNGYPLRNVTLEEFLRGKSRPINKALTKIAMNIEITDQTGKGNKDIVREYGKDVFEISEHVLSVNIPYNPLALIGDKTSSDAQNDAQNDAQSLEDKIISLIIKNNKITRIQMAKQLGVSKATIERCLKISKRIVFKGHAKSGYWEVVD